jgi:O-antigen ligase
MNLKLLIKLTVGLSLYITIWSHLPGTELIVQFTSVSLMLFAAFLSILKGVKIKRFSILEICLLPIVIISAITSLATNNIYSFEFSIIFLLYCFALSLITRAINLTEILDVFVYTILAIVLTVLITQHQELINTLSSYDALQRFRPLNMHPNLTGMVYGGAAICLAFKGLYCDHLKQKILFLSAACSCILFILAASARAALVALIVVSIIWLYTFIKNLDQKRFRYLATGLGCLFLIGLLYLDQTFNFLSEILEFDSDTRGVDSGATGRNELWALGASTILEDTSRLLFGYGLRSSESSRIGFSLESSYLTLLFEIGIFSTILFLFLVYTAIRLAMKISKREGENGIGAYYSIAMLLLFLLLQSVFNRYLIAIGNFYSVFFLILLFGIFIKIRVIFRFT